MLTLLMLKVYLPALFTPGLPSLSLHTGSTLSFIAYSLFPLYLPSYTIGAIFQVVWICGLLTSDCLLTLQPRIDALIIIIIIISFLFASCELKVHTWRRGEWFGRSSIGNFRLAFNQSFLWLSGRLSPTRKGCSSRVREKSLQALHSNLLYIGAMKSWTYSHLWIR